jgi:hypothetical protein
VGLSSLEVLEYGLELNPMHNRPSHESEDNWRGTRCVLAATESSAPRLARVVLIPEYLLPFIGPGLSDYGRGKRQDWTRITMDCIEGGDGSSDFRKGRIIRCGTLAYHHLW